ncbi:MAG: amidohydrolase [Candidatus Thermoplasmatota archaeon]|nr:amidohydrolase [Candidatus Thermoplasmatota archaeon]
MNGSSKGNKMKIAIVQFNSGKNKEENLDFIKRKIGKFSGNQDMVIFPEYSMVKPDFTNREYMIGVSEPVTGEFVEEIRSRTKAGKIAVVGNFVESRGETEKPFNTSFAIDNMGILFGKYQKIHLFDSYGYTESKVYNEGLRRPEVISVNGIPFGMEICYDIRFPELSRLYALKGARLITVQAGFFKGDYKLETFRILLKSIAMTNGVFVAASSQPGPEFIGHSAVISPSGKVLAELDGEEDDLTATIDMDEVTDYRREVNVLNARRRDFYDISGL